MLKEILKEELGISNEVNELTNKVKNSIALDFNKYKDRETCYTIINLGNGLKGNVFVHNVNVNFEGLNIPILYSILINPQPQVINAYDNIYLSNYNENEKMVFLYLACWNGKIAWEKYSSFIQHELHHMFQHLKKGKNIISNKEQINYANYVSLLKQKDNASQFVGRTLYYAYKAEKEALMNEFYRRVMEYNEQSYSVNPIDLLKEYPRYKDINTIKNILEQSKSNETLRENINNVLKTINFTYDKFVKLAEKMISDYVKAFGRTISKCKHDLIDKHKGKVY